MRQPRRAFVALETAPSQTFYGLTFASIVLSAILFLFGRRTTALFVGEWAPTFLLLGLTSKLLRPSQEQPLAQMKESIEEIKKAA